MTQREDFVRCAHEQVGKRYVWATAGPNTFDCSGLVAYCYRQATGKTITRSSYEQFSSLPSTPDNAEVGSLRFYDTEHNGSAGHVAIVTAPDTVTHAMNPERGVINSNLRADMGGGYIGSRRLFVPDKSPTEDNPAPMEDSPNPKVKPRSKRHRRHLRREGKL